MARRERWGGPVVLLVVAVALAACDARSAPAADADDGPAGVVSCADGSIAAQGSSAQANAMNTWIRNYQPAAAASLGLLQGFLTYTASTAGQAAVTRLGYAPLPEEIRRQVTAAVAGLG